MGYLIAAQISVMVQLSGSMLAIVSYAVPSFLSKLLRDLWMVNPKCFVFVLAILMLLLYRCYPIPSQEESLLVMRSLGVQTTSRGSSRFIPKDEIQDIIIHEGFKGFEVRFYLAILLKTPGQNQIEVVFPDTLPRRRALEQVWKDARKVLFDVA